MKNTRDTFEHLVDAACNGMSLPARRALDVRLQGDPKLRDAIELQRRIDDSLRRHFIPPAGVPLPFQADEYAESRTPRPTEPRPSGDGSLAVANRSHAGAAPIRAPWRWYSAIAAVFTLLLLGTWNAWLHLDLAQYERHILVGLDHAYERVVAGEASRAMTADPDALAREIERRFGVEVQFAAPPSEVALLDVLDCSTLSPRTISVLARAGDDHIVLLIDTAGRGLRPRLPRESGLRVHRATTGSLALFEMSPRSRPLLVGLITGGRRLPPCDLNGASRSTTSSGPLHDLQAHPAHTAP